MKNTWDDLPKHLKPVDGKPNFSHCSMFDEMLAMDIAEGAGIRRAAIRDSINCGDRIGIAAEFKYYSEPHSSDGVLQFTTNKDGEPLLLIAIRISHSA